MTNHNHLQLATLWRTYAPSKFRYFRVFSFGTHLMFGPTDHSISNQETRLDKLKPSSASAERCLFGCLLEHAETRINQHKFKCQCEADYVGRTSLHFETRINQHVPEGIRKGTFRLLRPTKSNLDSAIGQHLLANATCAQNYTLESFSILFRARSDNHLKFLESVAIAQLQPTLCHQKRFARSLFLFGEKI